ncbi:hypothetical protein GW17_00045133 [Ensete ventricosum]|nr:hypothetical protein GW17_00045133 [Ensete ventricosum]
MGSHTSMVPRKMRWSKTLPNVTGKVKFRSIFRAPSQKFKILAIPNVLAHGKSYNMVTRKMGWSQTLRNVTRKVEFRSVFRAPSQKFKIRTIPYVLAHRKSYEHGFAKKHYGHKLCTKSRMNRVSISFLCTVSEIQNTGHSQCMDRKSYEHGFVKK